MFAISEKKMLVSLGVIFVIVGLLSVFAVPGGVVYGQDAPNRVGGGILRYILPNQGDIGGAILSSASYAILTFASLLVGIAGKLLNFVIDTTIVNLATTIKDITAINIGWQLIRDVINAAFIFIVLFIAISIILRVQRFGQRKLLVNIVIAALLINFSLFFTRIIIDASNVITVAFYEPIRSLSGVEGSGTFSATGFSGAFMNMTKLGTIYSGSGVNQAVIQLGGAIFGFIAAFVFFAVAFLLIIRFILFIILMVTSPVMFLGLILPSGGDNLSGRWWSTLWDQTLFAPFFMILASLSFLILGNSNFLQDGSGIADALTKEGSIAIIFNFTIVTGFLIASLIIAKTTASKSAGKFVNFGTKVVGGATLGGAATLSRNTIGRAANKLASSEVVQSRLVKSRAGIIALKGLHNVGSGSFDVRDTAAVKSAGIDLGKAKGKGGYEKKLKDQVATREKFAETIIKGVDNQLQYAQTLKKRSGGTLWTKIARKDKEAAKKIQEKAEKRIAKKKLPELRKRRVELENQIRQTRERVKNIKSGKTGRVLDSQGRPITDTAELEQQLVALENELINKKGEIENVEFDIQQDSIKEAAREEAKTASGGEEKKEETKDKKEEEK